MKIGLDHPEPRDDSVDKHDSDQLAMDSGRHGDFDYESVERLTRTIMFAKTLRSLVRMTIYSGKYWLVNTSANHLIGYVGQRTNSEEVLFHPEDY